MNKRPSPRRNYEIVRVENIGKTKVLIYTDEKEVSKRIQSLKIKKSLKIRKAWSRWPSHRIVGMLLPENHEINS